MKYMKLFEQEDDWWEEESPFDDLESDKELKEGDYVVILNNRFGGQLEIGGVYKISTATTTYSTDGYIIENHRKFRETWWYDNNDVRRATKKEIEIGYSL